MKTSSESCEHTGWNTKHVVYIVIIYSIFFYIFCWCFFLFMLLDLKYLFCNLYFSKYYMYQDTKTNSYVWKPKTWFWDTPMEEQLGVT